MSLELYMKVQLHLKYVKYLNVLLTDSNIRFISHKYKCTVPIYYT
jgi:hypothetical protein